MPLWRQCMARPRALDRPTPALFAHLGSVASGDGAERLASGMQLNRTEEVVVRRAVAAYQEVRNKGATGAFRGVTADQILEELNPTPGRWVELAAFVIACAEGDDEQRFRSALVAELRRQGTPAS